MIIFHQKINLIFNKKPLELIIVYRDWEMELTRFLMKSQMKGNRSSKETIKSFKTDWLSCVQPIHAISLLFCIC